MKKLISIATEQKTKAPLLAPPPPPPIPSKTGKTKPLTPLLNKIPTIHAKTERLIIMAQTTEKNSVQAGEYLDRLLMGVPEHALIVLPEDFMKTPPGEVSLENRYLRLLSKKAKAHNTYILCGTMFEKNPDGDGHYKTTVLLGPDGSILGSHRKIDVLSRHCLRGSHPTVVDTPHFGKIGLLICADADNFLNIRSLCQDKDLNLVLIPLKISTQPRYKDRDTELKSIRNIAISTTSSTFQKYAEEFKTIFVRVDHPHHYHNLSDLMTFGNTMLVNHDGHQSFSWDDTAIAAIVDIESKSIRLD